jgi:hypothetical protein
MGGEIKDGLNSVLFFKKLSELTKEKSIKAKIAVEVSINLIGILSMYTKNYSTRLYTWLTLHLMFQVFKINDMVKYVDLLLFENTSPENRIEPKFKYDFKYRMFEQFGTLDSTVYL